VGVKDARAYWAASATNNNAQRITGPTSRNTAPLEATITRARTLLACLASDRSPVAVGGLRKQLHGAAEDGLLLVLRPCAPAAAAVLALVRGEAQHGVHPRRQVGRGQGLLVQVWQREHLNRSTRTRGQPCTIEGERKEEGREDDGDCSSSRALKAQCISYSRDWQGTLDDSKAAT